MTFNDGRGSFIVDFTLLISEIFSIGISFIVLFFDSYFAFGNLSFKPFKF